MLQLVGRQNELRILTDAVESGGTSHAQIAGPAGMGKTRLLQELSMGLRNDGVDVEVVVASASELTVPFAPFAHVLEPDGVPINDSLPHMRRILSALTARRDRGPFLLLVDDAQRLDGASIELLHQAMSRHGVGTVLAAAPEPALDPRLRSAVRSVGGPIVDLPPLGPADCDRLAQDLLRGEIDDEVHAELVRLSGGNPLFAIELLTAGVEIGAIMVEGDGIWHLRRRLSAPPRIQDVIRERLRPLPDASRRLLDLLAVTDGVPLNAALHALPLAAITVLEEAGLVRLDERTSEPFLRLAHDLHREVLLDAPATRLTQARGDAIEVLDSVASPDPLLELLAGRLSLDTGHIAPERALRAAQIALRTWDPRLAIELSVHAGETTSAQIVKAAALGGAGRWAEARAVFEALEAESDADLAGQIATEHAIFLLMHTGEPLAALERLHAALDRCEPGDDELVRSTLSMVLFFAGQMEAAVALAAPLLERPGTFPPSAGPALASGWAAMGNPAGVLETWDRVWSSLTHPGSDHSMFIDLNLIGCRQLALLQLGRAPEADDPLAGIPVDASWPTKDSWVVQHSAPATQAFLRGHLDVAAARFDELSSLPCGGPLQISVQTDAIVAVMHAQRGDVDRARRSLASIDEVPTDVLVPFEWWIDRARVWVMAAEGDLGAAVARCVALADRHDLELFYATVSLHDVVRLGRSSLVVERLRTLADRPGATWLDQTYAAHAVAATQDDVPGLLAVSERFEEGGLDLEALECAAEAASASVDRPGVSSIARSRAERLGVRCGRFRTPATEMRPQWLTQREIEVSRLAARGWTNGRIADRLGTSRRTVGNQLQSAYQKLGINCRADLMPLFPPG